MTEISRPWTGATIGDAGPYSADQWAHLQRNAMGFNDPDSAPLLGSGAAPEVGLTVAATSPASAGVRVFAGSALVQGTYYETDATVTLAIAANASGNPRIDTIILRKDFTLQTIRLAVLQGTPGATPVAPALTQSDGVMWESPLADIAVANGFSTIVAANITPRRVWQNAADGTYLLDVLNNTAGILECGDIVINDSTADRGAKTTTTARDKNVIGVWMARTAAGGYGRVIAMGIGYVKTSAAATRGDFLAVSATAKQADVIAGGAAATVSKARIIGTALETTTGSGLCLALINIWWAKDYAYQVIKRDNNANYTTTSTSFVNVDGTNLSITLTVNTGKVEITFTAMAGNAGAAFTNFDISIDGTRYGSAGASGLIGTSSSTANVSFTIIVDGLSVGSHTFNLVWAVGASTGTLYAGVGSGTDCIVAYSVKEVE